MDSEYFNIYRDDKKYLQKYLVSSDLSKPDSQKKKKKQHISILKSKKHIKIFIKTNFKLFDIYKNKKCILADMIRG